MTYQIIITEETAANIIIDNNTTNVSITTTEYPITIEYNATQLESAYGNANVAANLAAFANNPISTTGNITGGYFVGNGSLLTGIAGSSYGNANVVANLAALGSNPVSTTGNVSAGYFLGNGSLLTNLTGANVTGTVANATYAVNANAATYSTNAVQANVANVANSVAGANVSGTVANATYALNSNAATYAGTVTTAAQPNITSVGILTAVNTSGNISATGNITGNYFLGNGSQLTGLPVQPGTYGNANVAANLAAFGSNPISTTGNITAGTVSTPTVYSQGMVTQGYDFVQMQYSNAVSLPVSPYDIGVGSWFYLDASGAAFESNTTGTVKSIALSNNGSVSAAGNITGNYFLGNGSQLTGLPVQPGTYGNANVAANLAAFGSNPISTTGNITAGYFVGNGSALTGVIATDAIHATTLRIPVKNTSGGTLAQNTPVYATGSVGATETLEVSASRADTAATMPCFGLLETALGVNAFGYAVAIGALSSTDTSTYTIGQPLYVAPTGGLTQSRPTNANVVQSVGAAGRINGSTGQIEVNIWNQNGLPNLGNGNVWIGNAAAYPTQTVLATYSGNIGAGYFSGNGSLLSAITGANVTGTVANATYAASAGSATTAVTANTVTDAAQANITSVGTLTSVSVSGNTTSGNLLTGGLLSVAGNTTGANLFSYYSTVANSSCIVTNSTVSSNVNVQGINPFRWTVGSGFSGDYGINADPLLINRGSQMAVIGTQNLSNADAIATARLFSATQFINLQGGANVTATTKRYSALGAYTQLGNGNITTTVTSGFNPGSILNGGASALVVGNQGNVNLGNAYVSHAAATNTSLLAGGGGNIGNAAGYAGTLQTQIANSVFSTSMIGFVPQFQGTSGTTAGNVIGFYMPSNVITYGWNSTNLHRAATNYYAFKNDDAVAQVQLGSLRAYHQYQYPTATSGTVNIDKNNSQVQFIAPTANVTIGDFQNFVTTANDGTNNDTQADTVTLVIQQGATPYTVTMPTGNAAIKYAGGVSTIGATANAVTMVSISAVRSAANATMYLASISSEFS
jgi:hypothetical protein